MKAYHPTIILDYVPGGCTGVVQPCDIGIQRPFKLSTKWSYHEDIVNEFLRQIENGEDISIDDRLAIHRNRSVCWLWNAYQAVNKKELVKKVSRSSSFHVLTDSNAIRHLNSAKSEDGTCLMNP